MMPVCSATPSCSFHPQNSFHGGPRPFFLFRNDFESRCNADDRVVLGWQNGIHLQRISFKTQAERSLSSHFNDWSSSVRAINEMDPTGSEKLEHVESYSISGVEKELMDFPDQSPENADSFARPVEPDIMLTSAIPPEDPSTISDSLDIDNNPLPSVKTSFVDFFDGFKNSIDTSVNKGENTVRGSLDLITSSITSITKSASDAVDNVLNSVVSAVDQTRGVASNRLTGFSSDLKEATSKATIMSIDVLRATIIAAEDSLVKGASFVVFTYGSVKELLPPEIMDALNLSEEKAGQVLRPIGTAFQQMIQ